MPGLMHECLLPGDLLTALLLAWLHKHPGNLKLAVELAIGGLQAVLGRTIEAAGDAVIATELSSEVRLGPCPTSTLLVRQTLDTECLSPR